MGVTSKPEVTVLPLPSPPPAAPASPPATGVSNSGSASCLALDGGAAAPPSSERHVLIVASDGLWEWVSNAQAVGIASAAATAEDAAHMLVEAAHKQWAVRYRGRNCDDVSAAGVCCGGAAAPACRGRRRRKAPLPVLRCLTSLCCAA